MSWVDMGATLEVKRPSELGHPGIWRIQRESVCLPKWYPKSSALSQIQWFIIYHSMTERSAPTVLEVALTVQNLSPRPPPTCPMNTEQGSGGPANSTATLQSGDWALELRSILRLVQPGSLTRQSEGHRQLQSPMEALGRAAPRAKSTSTEQED